MTRDIGISDEELARWASEHLWYEITTLDYAKRLLVAGPHGQLDNLALESFVIHARCLNDFLWRDPSGKRPDDLFAVDFCPDGAWEIARSGISQSTLAEIRRDRRFGGEVMHLTRRRIAGSGEEKQWPVGQVHAEIVNALSAFGGVALPELLGTDLRDRLMSLPKLGGSETRIPKATGTTAGTALYDPASISDPRI